MSNNLLVACEGTIPLTADRFAEVARRRWPDASVRRLRPPRASAVDVQVVGPAGVYRISYFRDRRSFSCDALWPGWGEVAAWLRSVVPDDGQLLVAVDAALTMHVTLTPGITAAEFESRAVSHADPGWTAREPAVAAMLGLP